jgi:tRNA (adenine57-N1/adenine58-N1)-methyltransferase
MSTVSTLRTGERVVLVDRKERRYVLTLQAGASFHTHAGVIAHDDIIGCDEGATVRSTHGTPYIVLRPTLAEFVLKMPRGAQVIYPKDLGPLLMLADIYPGARVFESGVGSGALSMTMLRAGAHITAYEVRADFADRAARNVRDFLGADALTRYCVEQRDTYEGVDDLEVDRFVLDLPEPWRVVPHASRVLRGGGILAAYTPSIVQVMQLRDALAHHGFLFCETIEVLNRSWHIEGAAVRPDHRMVAHTGFLTTARLVGEGWTPPRTV